MIMPEIKTTLDIGDEVITREYNMVDKNLTEYRQRVASVNISYSRGDSRPYVWYAVETWFANRNQWIEYPGINRVYECDLNKLLPTGQRRYEFENK